MKTIEGREEVERQVPDLLYDEARYRAGVPEIVYYPESTDDVVTTVCASADKNRPIVVIGGQTGITGGSVPIDGCSAICFSAMNRIREVTFDKNGTPQLICDPGVTLDTIASFLTDPDSLPYQVPGRDSLEAGTWLYPPDPTEMSAELGGTVATNASGARSFRFGATREHIHSLSLVLAGGETATVRRGDPQSSSSAFAFTTDQGSELSIARPAYRSPELKNASGYYSRPDMELIDLFIGSEGTLGLFTRVGITLVKRPEIMGGLTFLPGRREAFAFADFLRGQEHVAAIEYFGGTALKLLADGKESISLKLPEMPQDMAAAVYWEYLESPEAPFEEAMEQWEEELNNYGSSFDSTWSGFELAEMGRLKAFRHGVPELVNFTIAHYQKGSPSVRKVSTDSALPPEKFAEIFERSVSLVERQSLEYVCFGHLGDYHLHINILPHTQEEFESARRVYSEIMTLAIDAGGTVSAEHGIGRIKMEYLAKMYGIEAIEEMRRIKGALDPHWLLNPGNLFAAPNA